MFSLTTYVSAAIPLSPLVVLLVSLFVSNRGLHLCLYGDDKQNNEYGHLYIDCCHQMNRTHYKVCVSQTRFLRAYILLANCDITGTETELPI
jgi:hypothetical protein